MKLTIKIFSSLVIFLFLTEITCRTFFPEELKYWRRPLTYKTDSILNYVYEPNLRIESDNKSFWTNSLGLVGKEILPKSNIFRIVIVGNSMVAGSSHLSYYSDFCSILDEKLKADNINAEVLNFGIDGGFRGYEQMLMIENVVMKFAPDLVLLEYDFPIETLHTIRGCYRDYMFSYSKSDPIGTKEQIIDFIDKQYQYKVYIDIFYKNSYAIRGLYKLVRKCIRGRKLEKTELGKHIVLYGDVLKDSDLPRKFDICSFDESAQWIKKIQSNLSESKCSFFLFQYGRDLSKLDIAQTYKLPLISLNILLEEADYIKDDDHPNKKGHEKIAQVFFERLIKYNLVPN